MRYIVRRLIFKPCIWWTGQPELTDIGPTLLWSRFFRKGTLVKGFHTLLVKELYAGGSAKEAGMIKEHEHPRQEFLAVGTVV